MTEVAKFLAGFSATRCLRTARLRFGRRAIHYDRGLNILATVVWGAVLALCIWFAWIRTRRSA